MSEEENSFPCNTDSYQMQKSVTAVIYLSGHTVENLVTHPENQSLTIEADVDGKHCLKAWAFYGEVKPDTLKVDRGSKKIEITLQKVQAMNWPRAEAQDANTKPLYQKWQQVKITEEEDKGEGFEHFIRQMYKNATPDEQRAMMKSFTESGGTVLSGDWADVGSRKVEPKPPQ